MPLQEIAIRQLTVNSKRISLGLPLIIGAAAALFLSIANSFVMHSDMNKQVERIIAREVAPMAPASGAGGVAAAVRIAGRTLFFNYGFAEPTEKRLITSDSLFNIGSVRKVFEAALVAHAVERGELNLNDPINKYINELQGDYIRRVAIGHLVTHTSGLLLPADHPPWPEDHYSLGGFLEAVNAWKPTNGEEPGKQRIYTHAGYVLLQLVLERRYGKSIAELIDHGITKPLIMSSTVVPERGPEDRAIMAPELVRRAVQGYSHDGEAIGIPGDQQGYYDFPGTGQMFSSARDLAALLAACLGEGPAEAPLRSALQSTERERFRVNRQYGQAMAWEINDLADERIVDKPGGLNNASAYIGLVPQRRFGIVILINRGDVAPYEVARNSILPDLARILRTPALASAGPQ